MAKVVRRRLALQDGLDALWTLGQVSQWMATWCAVALWMMQSRRSAPNLFTTATLSRDPPTM